MPGDAAQRPARPLLLSGKRASNDMSDLIHAPSFQNRKIVSPMADISNTLSYPSVLDYPAVAEQASTKG